MTRFRSILVATDFSDHATHAVRRGALLAKHHAARLSLLHVVNPAGSRPLRQWFSPSIDVDLKAAQARRHAAPVRCRDRRQAWPASAMPGRGGRVVRRDSSRLGRRRPGSARPAGLEPAQGACDRQHRRPPAEVRPASHAGRQAAGCRHLSAHSRAGRLHGPFRGLPADGGAPCAQGRGPGVPRACIEPGVPACGWPECPRRPFAITATSKT